MRRIVFFLVVSNFIFLTAQVQVRREMSIMHSPSSMTIVAQDSAQANYLIDFAVQEFNRLESLISEWQPQSEISQVNAQAGIQPVKVSPEVFDFITRGIGISRLTDGAFDLTWASMDAIWKFDGSLTTLPDSATVAHSVRKVDYTQIIADSLHQTLYLKEKGMKLGTGGTGQGWGADIVKDLLIKMGVDNALLNISGDVCAWGKQADGQDWLVGVSNPKNKEKIFAYFPLHNESFTTSGNYEKFALIEGKKYTHIIDPRTGWPVTELASVSVFSPSTELSDALDTALMVMGKEAGMFLVNQLPGVECIMVDIEGNVFYSDHIKKNIIQQKDEN